MSLFKAKMHHIRFLVSVCLSADNRTNGRVRSSVQMEFDTNRRNTESNPTLNLNHNHTTEQYARSEHSSKYSSASCLFRDIHIHLYFVE